MIKQLIVGTALCVVLLGCAANICDKSKVQYVKEGFSSTSLESGGLALLPVVAGQGQEGYRRPFAESLNKAIASLKPNLKFLKWQKTMEILNEQNLTETYQNVISTYRETAIIDKNFLHEIGYALGVRYLLFVSLQEFHKASQTSYNILSGWSTTKTARVNAFAQIWDCGTGDVVWEGIGLAESKGGELTYEKEYEEYAHIAAEGLARKLP